MTVNSGYRKIRVRMLLLILHERAIGVDEVESEALALSLEQLTLAVAQLVAYVIGDNPCV